MNEKLFYFFFNLSSNEFAASFFVKINYFTYFLLFFIILASVLISKLNYKKVTILVLSGVVAWFFSLILKILFKIERPFWNLDVKPLIFENGYSFPSQHSAVFFSIAIYSFFINKKLGILLLLVASLVSISRMVLGVHYPIDVLAGIVIGLLVGFLFVKISKKK